MADTIFIIESVIDNSKIVLGLKQLEQQLAAFGQKVALTPIVPKDAVKQIETLNKNFTGLNTVMTDTSTKTAKVGKSTAVVAGETKKVSNALADVGRRVFVWGSLSALIFGALQNLKEFYDLTIKVDSAMAELKKVLPSETDFAALQGSSFNLAVQFGTDPLDVLQILKRFGQSGLSAKDAVEATRTALLALNTTGADTEQVFNAIIGANRIFGVEFERTGEIIDKIQRIQADFAIDAKDLIASIQGIGPAITVLGGDIDDLFANVAALSEAARVSGKEAANSLKRVFSRLVSKEGIIALQNLGVAVFETADKFRPLRDILGDLSVALGKASAVEKANIAITLAQVRQYPKFIALIDNYQRQQEALAKSINASGDAYRANLVVLDTYAKQSTIASNKLKQFAQESITSGVNFTQFTTSVKVGLASILDVIGEADRAFLGFSLPLAGVGGALFGLNRLLPAGTRNILKNGEALKYLSVEQGKVNIGYKLFGDRIQRTIPLSKAFTFGLLGLAAAVALVSAAWEVYTKEDRRRQQIIEESTDKFKKFQKGLESIDFKGIEKSKIETKFLAIEQTLGKLDKKAVDGLIPVKDLVNEFSKLLAGVPADQLLPEQLGKVVDTIRDINRELTASVLQPFLLELQRGIDNVIPTLNSFTKFLEQAETSSSGASDEIETLAKILANVNLSGEGITFGGDSFSGFIGPFREAAKTLIPLIDHMVELNNKLSVLKETSDQTTEAFKRQSLELETELSRSAKKGAKEIFELLQMQSFLQKAAEDSNAVGLVRIDEGQTQKTKQWAAIVRELSELLREAGFQFANTGNDLLKLTSELSKSTPALEEYRRSVDRLAAISFNTVSFLSALKKTTAGVLDASRTQISALEEIKKTADSVGLAFDFSDEANKAIDSSIRGLVESLKSSREESDKLKLELEALEKVKEILFPKNGEKIFAISDPNFITKLEDDLTNYRTRLSETLSVQEQNTENFETQLKTLTQLKLAAENLANLEKQRVIGIDSQVKLTNELLRGQVELNKQHFGENVRKASMANEKILRRIFDIEVSTLETKLKGQGVSESSIKTEKLKLEAAYRESAIQREIQTILELSSRQYDRINSGVQNIKSSFESLIGDTENFFDILKTKGSVFELLKRGVSGISDAIAKSDASVIARNLSKGTDGLFGSRQAILENALNELRQLDSRFPQTAKEAIASAMQNFSKLNEEAAKLSADINAQVIARLSNDIIKALMENFNRAQNQLEQAANRVKGAFQEADINIIPLNDAFKNAAVEIADSMTRGADYFVEQVEDLFKNRIFTAPLPIPVPQPSGPIQRDTTGVISSAPRFIDSPLFMSGIQEAIESGNSTFREFFGRDLTFSNPAGRPVEVKTESDKKPKDTERKEFWDALTRRGATLIGQTVGFSIAKSRGASTEAVRVGSEFGNVFGSIIGKQFEALGPFGGGALGGLFGSILGGLFGGKEDPAVQELIKIEHNTAALVDRLTPQIINAPSTFALPGTAVLQSGGLTITNQFTINGGNTDEVLETLTTQINSLYRRSATNYSNLG